MDNISKKDIAFRLEKIMDKASQINNTIEENNKEIENRYDFAKEIGIKIDKLNKTTEVSKELNNYITKVNNIYDEVLENEENEEKDEEYKLLNNILYLDDIKLKNISELVEENKNITIREYINMFADKANELIREEEIKELNKNIDKYSKINFMDKITGKAKIKKAMVENCNLKRVKAMNKIYIPENKSLYEIVGIVNNCGYKSDNIDIFISKVVNEFSLENPENSSLAVLKDEEKIPLFFNKEFLYKINMQNADMLDNINKKEKIKNKTSEYKMYSDMLINNITTLELLKFNNKIEDEVV